MRKINLINLIEIYILYNLNVGVKQKRQFKTKIKSARGLPQQ